MTGPALKSPRVSAAGYQGLAMRATLKREFAHGVMYAMARTSRRHTALASDMRGLLRDHLAAPCKPHALEVVLQAEMAASGGHPDPDAVVRGSDPDSDWRFVKQPVPPFEVRPESTRDDDCEEKSAIHRLLPRLEEHVLHEQHVQAGETFRKRTGPQVGRYGGSGSITPESAQPTMPAPTLH